MVLLALCSYFAASAFRARRQLKWLAASLNEKEEYLRLIIENTPDHILIQDQDLKYELVINPQLGLTSEEMLGKSDRDLLSPEDAERLIGIKTQVLRTGERVHVEVPLLSKEGKQEYFDGSYLPKYGPDGKINGLIGYFRNVTANKRVEEERIARERAVAASREKDIFLATVSHELRTPLTPILIWSQLLLTRKSDPAKEKVGLQMIEKCALAQKRLIDDLLDVSRFTVGKVAIEKKPVDLVEPIREAIDMIRLSAEEKSIFMEVALPSAPVLVSGDHGRLRQVVWNLLANSIKFAPAKGKVEVILDVLEMDGSPKARLLVRDDGKGIPAEFLPRAFEPFSQVDSTGMTEHGGLGLGLALVRKLVELHGGLVQASSPGEGQGTTMTVILPLREH